MIFNKLALTLTLCAGFLGAASAQNNGNQAKGGNGGNGGNGNNGQGTATSGNNAQAVLNPANIQTGSAQDGQGQVSGVASGQAASAT